VGSGAAPCPVGPVPPAAPLWKQTHSTRTDADVHADTVAVAEMPRVGGYVSLGSGVRTHPEIVR
jgi:hypothetical protein